QEEGREQVLELVPTAEDLRLGEAFAGRERLERLDEAGVDRVLDVGVDGPGTGLDGPLARPLGRGDVGQGRAEGEDLALWGRKAHEAGRTAGLGERDDGVGRAEVDADADAQRTLSMAGAGDGSPPPRSGARSR